MASTMVCLLLQVEAALFIIQCMCLGVHSDEDHPCIPALLNAILNLGDCHVALQHTAMRVVGELARWLDSHPEYLKFVFTFLRGRIHVAVLAPVVAGTVRQLCEHCQQTAVPHFDDLAQVCFCVCSVQEAASLFVCLFDLSHGRLLCLVCFCSLLCYLSILIWLPCRVFLE